MSAEIIEKLPKPSPEDHRAAMHPVRELEEDMDMLFVSECARLMFEEMDRQEEAPA